MMGGRVYSDEVLMAFADGELTPDLHAEIEGEVATDLALAQRVEAFRESRSLAKRAFAHLPAPQAHDDLAARVAAMVENAGSHSRAQKHGERRRVVAANGNRSSLVPYLVAASLVATTGLAAGSYLLGASRVAVPPLTAIGSSVANEVAAHLSSVASGERRQLTGSNGDFEIVGTFMIGKTTCREFEIAQPDGQSTIAIACFSDGSWKTSFAMLVSSQTEAFVPASSTEPIDAYLEALSASSILTPEAEAAALTALK